jgi:hypothetical protein
MMMTTLSRVVRSSLVWAAALLTPVAGTPRIDCICPDGHVKLFCLSFALTPRACCGGGSCCSPGGDGCSCCGKQAPAQPARSHAKACCAHHQQRGTLTGARIAGTTCRKTLADADTQTEPPVTAAAHDHAAVAAPAPAPVALPVVTPANTCCLLSWQSYRLPPPTDPVIAFRHLVI